MKTISFREDMIDLIFSGMKTLTIRPVKQRPCPMRAHRKESGDWFITCPDIQYNEWMVPPCKYGEPGDVLGVVESPNNRKRVSPEVVCEIRITDTAIWRLDQIGRVEWCLDGHLYGKKAEFWDSFYGETDFAWKNDPFVWVIRFEVEP